MSRDFRVPAFLNVGLHTFASLSNARLIVQR
jgi:hypothetical protein